ncbi:hypothetical protein V1264_013897 [Littorina saxatilis]|uniref:BPTI/Kunitz inhibitor domain-containing protein n=2 Tax=Littorina saxatilis TaxID=31220 RepID=A0AAN9BRL5_9CAEN
MGRLFISALVVMVLLGAAHCQTDCTMPKLTGLCLAYFPRWFYNTDTKMCENFIYGGCGGNSNNFLSEDECNKACMNA